MLTTPNKPPNKPLGHVAFHADYARADITEAKRANYEVAIIVAPPGKRTTHPYYIPYVKGHPDPVF
jgi:hypothetical protein